MLVRDDTVTNRVAAPTKFAEYLACGLRVVISKGLGDCSDFVEEHQCGAVVNDDDIDVADLRSRLAASVNPAELCLKHFSKDSEGVNEAYRELLGQIG